MTVRTAFVPVTLCLSLAVLAGGCGQAKPRVVLYCAQDKEFAEEVLPEFTRQTGLPVFPQFDTEADKSVSLYEMLVREANRPRCDVHWNNEILSTIRLQRKGLLESYASPSAKPFPAWTQGPDDTWHAFASRARVLIVNTDLVKEVDRPKSIFDLTEPRWKGRFAMAKPQFGTTATQAACLFELLGSEAAKKYYLDLKANGVNIVPGNKQVAVGVAQGRFAVGLTDTDDAISEVRAGRPVAIIFPDRDGSKKFPRLGTLFIPNTVAIIKGGPNPDGARKLVDFLLSPEIEARLAESASSQIPLNPNVKANLPKEIETPHTIKKLAEVDFNRAADLWDEAQTFLANEFARP